MTLPLTIRGYSPRDRRLLLAYQPPSVAPDAPANLSATDSGTLSVSLTWDVSTGATSYNVYRGTAPGSLTLLDTVATNEYTDESVTGGTTYYYAVSAVNASGESAQSAEASAYAARYQYDTFTRADSASLGATEIGGAAYVKTAGSSEIASNRLKFPAIGTAQVALDFGTNKQKFTVTAITANTRQRFVVAWDRTGTGDSYYLDCNTTAMTLRRVVSGGNTAVASTTGTLLAAGDVVSVCYTPASKTVWVELNGTAVSGLTYTDTIELTGTEVGLTPSQIAEYDDLMVQESW